MKNKIELLSVLAVFALFAVIAVPSVSAQTYPANSVYFEPEDSSAQFCENTYVQIMVNANVDTTGAGMDIYFDPNCVNITNVDFTGSSYPPIPPDPGWRHWGDHIRLGGVGWAQPGTHLIANLTLHCEKEAAECSSDLLFKETELLDYDGDPLLDVTWHDGTFTCNVEGEKPDLKVSEITPNCGGYLFGKESNEICAKIENIGGGGAGAFNVGFDIDGFSTEVRISGLAAGENTTVCINDTMIRTAGDSVTITVTADCDGEVSESDETNNVLALAKTVVNNGYKGKRYTGGEDINTWKTFELNGNLIYSLGDSYYLSSYSYPDWTEYNAGWDASELPIPGTATIETARLFVPYTWDKTGVMPTSVSMSFNGNSQTLDAHYSDEKGWGTSYPYGMLAYDVTADFDTSGNVANLTNSCPGGDNVSMRGMLLVVVYADASEPERMILMNEEFDLLYGGASKCTTPEEATAYAPFGTIDTAGVEKATLITVAPGAGPNEGNLGFNGHMWYDVWNFVGPGTPTPQIGIAETDVTTYLQAADNIAKFQSSEDYMEASNAFLVVAYDGEEEPDLTVTEITPNCGGYLFGKESNEICAKIENIGGGGADAFNVGFDIDGFGAEVRISGLAAAENTTVCINDTTIRTAGDSVTITVTADCDGEVSESDETNNVLALAKTVVNNGYKGKRYTGGDDINTWKTFELNGNLIYSLGDSYYLSSYSYPDWTEYNAGWTTGDLPIPGTATIETARLFVPYTWDKTGVMPAYAAMSFNGNLQTLDAHYLDEKGWGTSYPYGMLVYDVTADFNTSGNAANLTNSYPDGGGVSMRGMLLVVVYADASEPERTILMNEEFDLLYGGASKCTTPEEATAYAPFGTIDTAGVKKATLITVAPGAGPNEGDLGFNGHMWYDVWNFVGTGTPTPQIGIAVTDVNTYLQAADNIAKFQSSEDYMEASNAFLILEKEEEPMPDLEITDIWNNDGTIWFKIENRGTEEAGSSYTALYVNGAYQASKKVGSLDSRKSTELYFRYVYTPGTDDILKVCADRGNDVAESNEGNNCKELIPDGKPDLVIENKWEEWVNETHYSVTYTIHNKGTAIAPAGHNTTLYVDGVAIEHKHVPVALAHCEKYTDTFDTTIECTGYSDIIRVCADNYEVIDELDETNNCMTNEFRCVGPPPGPDLVITNIWENDGTIWFKIENRGTEEAGSSYTALYVNGAYQASKKVGSLDSGESTELYFRYVYTPGTDDIVEVCADRGNDVAESNEANNCRTVIWE